MTSTASRRSFLAGLGGVGAGLVAGGATAATPGTERTIALLETYVAGAERFAAPQALGALEPGQHLVLQREPSNPYDTRSVAVLTREGQMLGYVPRIDNKALANLLDQGFVPRATVSRYKPGSRPNIGLSVALTLQV